MAKDKDTGRDESQLFYAEKMNELVAAREKMMRRTAAQGDRQANVAKLILAAQEKAADSTARQNQSTSELLEKMDTAKEKADELAGSFGKGAENAEKQAKVAKVLAAAARKAAEMSRKQNVYGGKMAVWMSAAGEKAEELADHLEDAAENAEGAAGGVGGILSKLKKYAGPMAMGAAAFGGIASGMQKIWNFGSGVVSTLFAVAKGIASIALAVISIPFKLFFGMIEAVGNRMRIDPVIKALENIREKVGDLGREMGKAARTGARKLVSQQYATIAAGRSLASIFGYGREGAAAAVEYFGTIIEGLGSSMEHATKDIKHQARELVVLSKAMAMTAEDVGVVNSQAKALGKDGPGVVMAEQASWVVKAGRRFKVSFKNLNKDVNKLRKQFVYFGGDAKSMTMAAVYARKLGVAVESLGKTMDAWLDFDKAAESAAGLAQVFGANVDIMKMVTSNSPAASMDELRRAVLATGRSFETMTIAERKALMQMTSMDEKTAMMAFSAENAHLSYDQVTAGMEDSEAPMMSAAKAMKTLVNEIKKVFMDVPKVKGFFDALSQGFMKGVEWSGPFQNTFWTLQDALRQTYHAGVQLGGMFVKHFPGIENIFTGMAKMFEGNKWASFLGAVTKQMEIFFKMLEHDPRLAIETMLDGVQEAFGTWFGTSASTGGGMVMQGFSQFTGAIGGLFEAAMQLMVDKVTEGINRMMVYIDHPELIPGGVGDAFTSFTTKFQEAGNKAVAYLEESFTGPRAQGLAEALGGLISSAIDAAFGAGTMAAIRGRAKHMIKDAAQTFSDVKEFTSYLPKTWMGWAGVAAGVGAVRYGTVPTAKLIGKGIKKTFERVVKSTVVRDAQGRFAKRTGRNWAKHMTRQAGKSLTSARTWTKAMPRTVGTKIAAAGTRVLTGTMGTAVGGAVATAMKATGPIGMVAAGITDGLYRASQEMNRKGSDYMAVSEALGAGILEGMTLGAVDYETWKGIGDDLSTGVADMFSDSAKEKFLEAGKGAGEAIQEGIKQTAQSGMTQIVHEYAENRKGTVKLAEDAARIFKLTGLSEAIMREQGVIDKEYAKFMNSASAHHRSMAAALREGDQELADTHKYLRDLALQRSAELVNSQGRVFESLTDEQLTQLQSTVKTTDHYTHELLGAIKKKRKAERTQLDLIWREALAGAKKDREKREKEGTWGTDMSSGLAHLEMERLAGMTTIERNKVLKTLIARGGAGGISQGLVVDAINRVEASKRSGTAKSSNPLLAIYESITGTGGPSEKATDEAIKKLDKKTQKKVKKAEAVVKNVPKQILYEASRVMATIDQLNKYSGWKQRNAIRKAKELKTNMGKIATTFASIPLVLAKADSERAKIVKQVSDMVKTFDLMEQQMMEISMRGIDVTGFVTRVSEAIHAESSAVRVIESGDATMDIKINVQFLLENEAVLQGLVGDPSIRKVAPGTKLRVDALDQDLMSID